MTRLPRSVAPVTALLGAVLLAACSPAGRGPTLNEAAPAVVDSTQWPSYHRDAAHSGYQPGMPSPSPLRAAWKAPLDGVVQASPLVVGDLVIAATENNTVYGLRRTTGAVVWSRHLAAPVPAASLPCGNITPTVGITGTPVFDSNTGQVFAVTTSPKGSSIQHDLVGLDPRTGRLTIRRPVDAAGSDPVVENQRGALGIANGRILVPYGGHAGDCGNYHGYLVSVLSKDGTGLNTFRVGTAREAGLWQPSGPAVDRAGIAYVVAGNGSATGGAYDGSDSVNAVDPATGRLLSRFAPAGWAAENAQDLDLGSSGAALVGDKIWVQGKTSTGYLLRRGALGGIGHPLQTLNGACATQFGGPAVHNNVVFAPCTDGVRQLVLRSDGTIVAGWRAPAAVTGSPVVGAGLVWSLDPAGGVLYALGEGSGRVFSRIAVGPTVRFATPALSGNLVFVPTRRGITAVSGG